jgi:hypothetical protein
MNLTKEKEKIKKEIDLIDDPKIIKAIKHLLAEYEEDATPAGMLNEPPIEDWEMALPIGRTPTPAQLEKWLDKDEGESMTGEEALKYSLEKLKEYRAKRKEK